MKFFQNITRFQRIAKEFSWIAVGQFFAILGSLFLLKTLTISLNPTQFGQFALSLTMVGFVNAVLMGGIVNGVARYFSIAVEEENFNQYLKASFRLIGLVSFGVSILALLFIIFLYWIGNSKWIGLVLASLIFSILGGYTAFINGIHNAARHRSIVAFHTGLDPWIKIFFVITMVFLFGGSSTVVAFSYAFSLFMIVISQLFYLKRLPKMDGLISAESKNINWSKKIWSFSWPFIIWGFFGWIQISSTRWAFQAFGSTADVGYYSVLSQLGYVPIQTIIGILITFLLPIVYSIAGNGEDEFRRKDVTKIINKISFAGLILTILATLFAFFFHRQIMIILVSEEYWAVSKYLPILVSAGGVFGIALLIASKYMSFMSVRELMPASIGSSIIGTFAAFIGVYLYAFTGGAFAMLIHALSYLIMLLMIKPRNRAIEIKNEF